MTKRPPPRSRAGFTLIELLIVVVILGLLASLAIPRFAAARDRASYAAVKSDLRNLTNVQELFFADYQTYASAADIGTGAGQIRVRLSGGVSITAMTGDAGSWSAVATHARLGGGGCAVHFGSGAITVATPLNGDSPASAGVVACDDGSGL